MNIAADGTIATPDVSIAGLECDPTDDIQLLSSSDRLHRDDSNREDGHASRLT